MLHVYHEGVVGTSFIQPVYSNKTLDMIVSKMNLIDMVVIESYKCNRLTMKVKFSEVFLNKSLMAMVGMRFDELLKALKESQVTTMTSQSLQLTWTVHTSNLMKSMSLWTMTRISW